MKFQTVYETNADHLKTLEKLRTHPSVGMVDRSSKGHLCFKFKDSNYPVELVESTGRLHVTWENKEEKERLYPLLKQVLATRSGEPLEIHPEHTTVYRIPYPPPRGFQLSYCSESIQYLGIHARELGALKATLGFIPILVGLGLIALESRRRRELRLRHIRKQCQRCGEVISILEPPPKELACPYCEAEYDVVHFKESSPPSTEVSRREPDHKTVNGENFIDVCDSCFYHYGYDVSQTWKHLYNIGGVSCFRCDEPATRMLKQESCMHAL